jgi:aminoglycoside phosphotransferase (APT) family kinase protein
MVAPDPLTAPWPFSSAELTAGLRRYFAEPGLQVRGVRPSALAGEAGLSRVRALSVEYGVGPDSFAVECVVKEPVGATRAGLAGAGQREIGLYRSLAAQLPMSTPALIAADPKGEWLVLEQVESGRGPGEWSAQDYRRAVQTLAELHERFWNLADDLAAYQWLARPLTADFEIHVYAAAQAMEKMMAADWPPEITHSTPVLGGLAQIISQIETVVQSLRAEPPTLLHGEYVPSNVALLDDGEPVVFDWQLAGLGPGVLDLAAFVAGSEWERRPLPIARDELIALYRAEMAQRLNVQWTDDHWALLWDSALLWRFTQEMFGWAASAPREEFTARAAAFRDIWLDPALAAAARRLRPVLYV